MPVDIQKAVAVSENRSKKRINLIGCKFGKLTVIAEGEHARKKRGWHRVWICRCECGTIKSYRQSNLINKPAPRSCGCSPRQEPHKCMDLTGNRYGLLTIMRINTASMVYKSRRKRFWDCVCDCGKKRTVNEANLISGHTRSCGCIGKKLKRGVRFGKLTILSAAPAVHNMRYYNVRCVCGKIYTVSVDTFLRASNVVCDCGSDKPRIDLTGQVFGRLTALMEVDPVKDSGGRNIPSWLCRCTCGKEVVVRRKNLLRKTTRSCGCLRRAAAKQFDPMSKRQ